MKKNFENSPKIITPPLGHCVVWMLYILCFRLEFVMVLWEQFLASKMPEEQCFQRPTNRAHHFKYKEVLPYLSGNSQSFKIELNENKQMSFVDLSFNRFI